MTPFVRAAVGGLGAVGHAGLLEQTAKIERASGVATVIGARVCRLRLRALGTPFEQRAEFARGTGMSGIVGAPIGLLRAGEIALLFQEQTELVEDFRLPAPAPV